MILLIFYHATPNMQHSDSTSISMSLYHLDLNNFVLRQKRLGIQFPFAFVVIFCTYNNAGRQI